MKKKYLIDIKFFGFGSGHPALREYDVTYFDGTQYGVLTFVGTEEEYSAVHKKLSVYENRFKLVGTTEEDLPADATQNS